SGHLLTTPSLAEATRDAMPQMARNDPPLVACFRTARRPISATFGYPEFPKLARTVRAVARDAVVGSAWRTVGDRARRSPVARTEGEPGRGAAPEAWAEARARRGQSGAERAGCRGRVPSARVCRLRPRAAADRRTPSQAQSGDRAAGVRAGGDRSVAVSGG